MGKCNSQADALYIKAKRVFTRDETCALSQRPVGVAGREAVEDANSL